MKYSVHVPSDFLKLTISASEHLLICGQSNVVYGLTKAIGTGRADKSDSRLPAKRMPIELLVNFYNANSYTKVKFSFLVANLFHIIRWQNVQKTTMNGLL